MSITFSVDNTSPELNLANGNFTILSQLLQLNSDVDNCGSILPELLDKKLLLARDEMKYHSREWERLMSESTGTQGALILECGLSELQIQIYFTKLTRIIEYAKQNNTVIHWC
jgi:hypothetical protein